jgi:ABC-type branched-subunit amino acid transport system substrate-binding protein
MITEKGARQSNITGPVKEALDSSSLAYSPFSYSILEGRDVTEPLTALMSTAGANRIIIASESEAFVNDVVRNLNLLIFNNLDIVLYAPSKVRGFETIEVENFHNTTMHVSLGYHIDYESAEVKAFLKKFRALYNTEPTQFAFQGYDIARYFMELCAKYGENWKEHLCDSPKEMLQSTFSFTRQGTGGHTNSGIRRIIYEKGYNIKRGHL